MEEETEGVDDEAHEGEVEQRQTEDEGRETQTHAEPEEGAEEVTGAEEEEEEESVGAVSRSTSISSSFSFLFLLRGLLPVKLSERDRPKGGGGGGRASCASAVEKTSFPSQLPPNEEAEEVEAPAAEASKPSSSLFRRNESTSESSATGLTSSEVAARVSVEMSSHGSHLSERPPCPGSTRGRSSRERSSLRTGEEI